MKLPDAMHAGRGSGFGCLTGEVCGADDKFGGARMRQRENRRVHARKFQNEITRAMHAGQERSD